MTFLRLGLAALLTLSLSSCVSSRTAAPAPIETPPAMDAAPAPQAPPATAAPANAPAARSTAGRPALWKISDADTTIWLFGTIHVLPPNFQWQNPVITQAVDTSDSLVIETVIDKANPQAMAGMLLNMGTTAGLPPFLDRVPSEKRTALSRMLAQSGMPPALFNALETWTGAFLLVGVTLKDLGLEGQSGVEDILETRFRAAAKPVSGLETPEQQLGYFDTLPEDAQREFLTSLVDPAADIRREFEAMLAAWAAGDEAGIAASFDEEIEISAKLRQVLLHDRNARWTDWLIARMRQPGKVFVAVGAGHLAGPESVLTMLRARGLTVERVQ